MKKLLSILLLLASCTIIFSCGGKAEKKEYTICISSSVEGVENDAMRQGLVTELKKLGLVEDQNVHYYYASAEGNADYAKQIVDEFSTKYNPDIFVTIGTVSTRVTSENFKEKPIVFLGVPNAEKLGYCDGDGNPTSNLTGVVDAHLIEEHLDYIAKNHKDVKKIGVIYTALNDLAVYEIDFLKFFATAVGIDIIPINIQKDADVETAVNTILPRVDAITLVHDNIVNRNVKTVVDKAKEAGKLVFGVTHSHNDAGAEVPTLRDYLLVGEDGAHQIKEILVDGKKVKDIKVLLEDFRVK